MWNILCNPTGVHLHYMAGLISVLQAMPHFPFLFGRKCSFYVFRSSMSAFHSTPGCIWFHLKNRIKSTQSLENTTRWLNQLHPQTLVLCMQRLSMLPCVIMDVTLSEQSTTRSWQPEQSLLLWQGIVKTNQFRLWEQIIFDTEFQTAAIGYASWVSRILGF